MSAYSRKQEQPSLGVASIVMPFHGAGEQPAHDLLRDRMLSKFGGYTESRAVGAWMDQMTGLVIRDVSQRFDVAVERNSANERALRHMAREAGELAHQQSVFVVMPTGEAGFVDTGRGAVIREAA